MPEEYFEMLAQKISLIYEVDISEARNAVANSAIQRLAKEYPEYVGHVSAYTWAEEIYDEMFQPNREVII